MKVLIYGLNYSPEPVGIGKYSGELGAWLAEQGHTVTVITAPPYFPQWHAMGNRYRQERLAGVLIWRCPLWVPHNPNGIKRLLHLASFTLSSMPVLLLQRQWRPNLIICVVPALFCAPAALLLKRLCGALTISWLHIQDYEIDAAFELGVLKGKQLRRTAGWIEKRLLKNFQRVSSISDAMRRRAISKGVEPRRAELLPNWVDLDKIYPKGEDERLTNPYRKELNLNPEVTVLMYSGSMNRKQGLEVLVATIKLLGERKDLVWVLGGEGPGKAGLIKATCELPQVLHMKLQPDERINDWLNLGDIHLLPQKAGAADLVLPSKVLGILASGRPMVATSPAKSTLGELAQKAGKRVNPGNAIAFAIAILELVGNERERRELGRKARKLAEEEYGKEKILAQFEQAAIEAIIQEDGGKRDN